MQVLTFLLRFLCQDKNHEVLIHSIKMSING
jgi:hypothetical protein